MDEKYISKCERIEINEDGLIKLIFEKAEMDLKDYIQKNKLNDIKKKKLMIKLLVALEYLQSFNIIHGDIKPSNILIFKNGDVKYTDFNLSSIYLTEEKTNKKLYTITYRPPEINEERVNLKSDIWALGCTFFEIYYGYEYFNYSKDKKFYHLKNSSESKQENYLFNDLIKSMINNDIDSRFTIDKIKNHPYFLGEEFPIKLERKEPMNRKKFINLLKMNFSKYNIKTEIDQKIFLSKFENFSRIPIHKNFRKIENKICQDNFSVKIFN